MSTDIAPPLLAAPPSKLSSYLTKQIIELIRDRNLRAGDRLPTAKVLAEQFTVAIPTLREALRPLQATGVIDIRHGSGIYVGRGQERLMLANPHHGALERRTIPQLLDARLLIEPHLAELTARRATDAEIADLERVLDDAERCLVDQDELLHRTNMAFHATIARASGNLVLAQIMDSLIEIYSSEQMATLALYNSRSRDHAQHGVILAAIRDRNGVAARVRMAEHIQDVKAVVEALLPSTSVGTDRSP